MSAIHVPHPAGDLLYSDSQVADRHVLSMERNICPKRCSLYNIPPRFIKL